MTTTLEVIIGRTLGAGVILATTLLGAGLVLSLVGSGALAAWLLNAGLLVLMATPMLRVALSCAEYVRERDWFFAISAFGVLLVLGMTVWAALGAR